MDMSSELIHSLLPLFLVSVLGASLLSVGIIEGLAESIALILKIFSGVLSDYWRKRKILLVIGYGMAAVTKPLFPMASSVAAIFLARFLDRMGKGIRGAPRDALIGDLAPPHLRGTCYGLRQSLDTIGAVLGPLLVVGLMLLLANQIRLVLWVAVIPAVLAVLLLIFGVKEPPPIHAEHVGLKPNPRLIFQSWRRAYWWIVIVGGILTLARFSEAFLVLRAEHAGLALPFVPLVMVIMSGSYALSSYPAGVFADRGHSRALLASGFVILIFADVMLALVHHMMWVLLGVALWGIHMGLTQGLLAALVAGAVPAESRGSAFGMFNLISGLALFFASLIAGYLWDQFGHSATFLAGAGFTFLAFLALMVHGPFPSK